jgi:RHS repeat-associated protein
MLRVSVAAVLFCSSVALRAVEPPAYVVPVATALVKGRVYSTTLALRNDGQEDVTCEAIYAVPNDPKGGTLRATYTVPQGGRPHIEEDVLMQVGAVGTMRLVCSGEVAIAARIQTSTDGGQTFDEGRTFPALAEAASFRRLRTVTARGDLLVAEVAGKAVTFEAIVKNDAGVVIGRKTYTVPPFAQQIVNLSQLRDDVPAPKVELRVTSEGGGALVVGEETRDPMLLTMAVRMTPEIRRAFEQHQARQVAAQVASAGPSITQQLLICPFKAAPFRDPATGLCFMRDRWYDPSTGTFLTPDPEGYADSSNLYIFGKGDPVNNSDPTGRRVGLWGDKQSRQRAYDRILRTLDNPQAAAHLRVNEYNEVVLHGISAADFIARYDGRARQLGQMIDSQKLLYVAELDDASTLGSPLSHLTMVEQIERAGGGLFSPMGDRKHAIAAFNRDRFPQRIADVEATADTTFVHELYGHGYDWAVPYALTPSITGSIPQKYVYNPFTGGISEGEAAGLWAENMYRLEHGLDLRTYYKRAKDDWTPPSFLAPYIARQHTLNREREQREREERRRRELHRNIWLGPGKR